MGFPGEAPLVAALVEWASRRLGFDRRALRLERLLLVAERELRRLGPAAFHSALFQDDAELDAILIAAVTVGETYLFRQREHFDLLGRLPFRGLPDKPLLAWSAGCASGEEAYSLAMSLREKLGLEFPALQIWGTDINEAALASAKEAAYGKWSFRSSAQTSDLSGPSAESLLEEALRTQILDLRTRACVRFARHNLLEEPAFDGRSGPRFHLIFCRNALVYFEPRATDRALKHLVQALVPGGWLVMANMDISVVPAGTRRIGPSQLCVFERVEKARSALAIHRSGSEAGVAALRPSGTRVRQFIAKEFDPEQAVSWHRGVLAQLERGEEVAALSELQALLTAFPRYLPGWFEQALALRRRGQRERALESLRRTLKLAGGLDPAQPVAGPEILSLDFYVVNAEILMQSLGGSI